MCVLRASGKKFDADRFLKRSSWKPIAVFRRGEARGMTVKKKNAESSFNLDVSDASWLNLGAQIRDAKKFIQKNKSELRRLKRFPGVESIVLDFPLENPISKEFPACFLSFPEAFIHLAAAAGLSIELSIYAVYPRSKS
jgi:hypothetical protein